MIEINQTAPEEVDRFRQRALIVGIVGLALCGLGAFFNPANFFRSYLVGFMFWVGIALGSLAILMVQHMSGGAWGLVIRRVLESATRTFPLLVLLFIPLALGVHAIYIWADPAHMDGNPHLKHKEPYLNLPFFYARAALYFLVWMGLAYFLNKWSLEQDRTAEKSITRRLQSLSGPGLVLFGATVTFSSIDWVMSLEPEWFSTIFGILFMGGQALSAMAFVIATMVLLSNKRPMSVFLRPSHLHDLGKLMMAFVMLWAYFHFSQFLIIWSGNLPEETPWYIRRINGGWLYVALAIVLFHFALPFVMLLSRDLKRNSRLISMIATVIIVMRVVDLFWVIAPAFGAHDADPLRSQIDPLYVLMSLAAVVGVGGLWLAYFAFQLRKRPLLPVGDPGLEKALTHGGGH